MINEEKKELEGREEKIRDVEKKIDFILQVYKTIQNLISFADTKANISLSIQSLLITIGLGSSLLANTFEYVQKLDCIVPKPLTLYTHLLPHGTTK